MDKENLIKKLNKYPKDVLIDSLLSLCWYNENKILEKVTTINLDKQFKKLQNKSNNIMKEIEKLKGKKGIEDFIKFKNLLEEDAKIQKKIDKLL